ncbi:thioredoxin domain-containing protein 11-like isoform X2 [Oscarella lobularis]|uniref:thioredoxin domain-containing protein 11-like isoform X2 n=1 Tax=Oscarella lobularis TaxID=121494 RepID=UPI003313693E
MLDASVHDSQGKEDKNGDDEGNSKDEQKLRRKTRRQRRKRTRRTLGAMLSSTLHFGTIVVALSLGSTLHHLLQATTAPAPPPIGPSIFPANSVNLVDLRNGSHEALRALTNREPFVTTMFYAPWSGQSRKVAAWYAEAARRFDGEIIFVAIDCWYLGGTCRQREPLAFYPRLLIYCSRREETFEYVGGLRSYEIIQFVELVLRPLLYISTKTILHAVIGTEETVVLGYFDFVLHPEPPEYLAYLKAAKLSLRQYVGDRLVFGVVSSETVAAEANMSGSPSLMLCRTNQKNLVYTHRDDWTPSSIHSWIVRHWEKRTNVLFNTLNLVAKLRWQPALILFLPLHRRHRYHYRNPTGIDPRLHMLRRVAERMHRCEPSPLGGRSQSSPVHTCGLSEYYYSILRPQAQLGNEWSSRRESGSSDVDDSCQMTSSYLDRLDGFGCNHAINLFYMDSLKFWAYAEALSAERLDDDVALVISDSRKGKQYVYRESRTISEEAIASFLWKFVRGRLEPTLASIPADEATCLPSHLDACVAELARETFASDVIKSKKDVLVLFYAPRCVFCTVLTPLLLRLAHALRHNNQLLIARFDTTRNDLASSHPIPASLPALILYPDGRKTTPVAYSRRAPVSIRALVDFLAGNVTHALTIDTLSHQRKGAANLWRLRRARIAATRRSERLERLVRLRDAHKRIATNRRLRRIASELIACRRWVDSTTKNVRGVATAMGGDQSLPSLRRHVADLTSKVRDAEIRSVGVFRTVAAAAAAAAANVVVTHATEHVGERERAPNDAPRSRALALRLRRLRYRLAVADRRLVVCSRSVVDCRLVGGEVQRTVERILEALRRCVD